METKRICRAATVSLNTAESTTPSIPIEQYASGEIFIPTGSSITTLTWWAAPTSSGTFIAAQDASGSAVTQTVSGGKAYPMPAVLFGAGAVKAVTNAAGDAIVNLKS